MFAMILVLSIIIIVELILEFGFLRILGSFASGGLLLGVIVVGISLNISQDCYGIECMGIPLAIMLWFIIAAYFGTIITVVVWAIRNKFSSSEINNQKAKIG